MEPSDPSMTTADWALVISLGSLLIALAGFVWNIWSKFIYPKPRVLVGVSVMSLLHKDGTFGEETFTIHATNFGPVDVILQYAVAYRGRWFQRKKSRVHAILNPYHGWPLKHDTQGPHSGGLPQKLEVGEQFTAHFPVEKDWFEKENLELFGFEDTFGRRHWCNRRQAKNVRERVLNPQPPADFPAPSSPA